MAKKKKDKAGAKLTSKVAMNKLKKSQNIAIMLMVLILVVGISLMIFCYMYDDLGFNSGKTAEQGQRFTVNSITGEAPVEISIETNAGDPPKFFIINADDFKQISPTLTVPNEYQDPGSVEQIDTAVPPTRKATNQKDFYWEGTLENGDWFVIVVTDQTEGGITFNMIYDISVYSFRPIALPIVFPIILVFEVLCFVYIMLINNKLKKVQEKVSTQRLLKAQMDMVRNFILQSSGTSQAFSLSASPYKSATSENVLRDGVPLAIAQGDVEIVECYACNELITINSPDRPLIVACPNCGVKSQVVEEAEDADEGADKIKTTLPPAEGERMMLPPGAPEGDGAPSPTPSPTPTPTAE